MMSSIRIAPRPELQQRQAQLDAMFPVARLIVEASTLAVRATLLLQVSDEIVLSHFASLTEACRLTGFSDGAHYLLERYAALVAVRDPSGLLRDGTSLELYRRGLVALTQAAAA